MMDTFSLFLKRLGVLWILRATRWEKMRGLRDEIDCLELGGAFLLPCKDGYKIYWSRRLTGAGCAKYINNISKMINGLFLLSVYCFRLTYLWLSNLTIGVLDTTEGQGTGLFLNFIFPSSVWNAAMVYLSSVTVVSYVCCCFWVYWSNLWIFVLCGFILQLSVDIWGWSSHCPRSDLLELFLS